MMVVGGIDEEETIRLQNKKARQDSETRRREMSMKNDEEKDAAGNSDIDDVHDGTECYSDEECRPTPSTSHRQPHTMVEECRPTPSTSHRQPHTMV